MSLKINNIAFDNLTTAQRDAIVSPEEGLVIYNSDNARVEENLGSPTTPLWNGAGGTLPAWTAGNSDTGLAQLVPTGDPILVATIGYNLLSTLLETNETLESNVPIEYKDTAGASQTTILDETNDKFMFPSNLKTFGKQYVDYTIRIRMTIDWSAGKSKFYVRLRRIVDNSFVFSFSFSQVDFPSQTSAIEGTSIKTFVNSESDPFVVGGAYLDILNDDDSVGTVTLQDVDVRIFRG